MAGLFPPVDPEGGGGPPRRRQVPFTAILPNLVTLLGLCAGLTAIRMAVEHRFDTALGAIVIAVILDGIDGRLARYFRATSHFGEQLDSLADFVDFGVAPAIFLYVYSLDRLSSFGWICALVLAICTGLRLARFNAALAVGEARPDWQRDFFVGVPAPAGALIVLLPFYLDRVGWTDLPKLPWLVAIYTTIVALLMVSRLPSLSGKRTGRVPRDAVLPVLVTGVLLVAMLFSYPFWSLLCGTVLYLAHLPFAWRFYRAAEAAAPSGPVTVSLDSGDAPAK